MKLTISIIHAIHDRLLKRHRATGDRHLMGVGMGWAIKGGQPDPARGLSVLYFVKRKRNPREKRRRIPKEVSVFLTKGRDARKRRTRAIFSTDVIEVPEPARLTGVALDGGNGPFTGGAVISWPDQNGNRRWGLLSVSHGVRSESVAIVPPGQEVFYGRVFAQTTQFDGLDAAIIEMHPNDVSARLGSILPPPEGPFPDCRTLTQLMQDGNFTHPPGYSQTLNGSAGFRIVGYIPIQNSASPLVPEEPNLLHLILVEGSNGTFPGGTSGSIWMATAGLADGIQVAGFDDNNSWRRGIGQPITDYLSWASAQVGSRVIFVAAL